MTVADVITVTQSRRSSSVPAPRTVLELFKPVTWFPPMWAFACGVASSGVPLASHWSLLLLGVLLTGPLVCGTSQAVNDWFDRHVDAINEPGRPIPSGRMPGTWGLTLAIVGTLVSLIVGLQLGLVAAGATALGLVLAWIYSAPPLRLKNNGWWGNAAVGFSYEGLAWVTGAALMLNGAVPRPEIFAAAVLYSIGAHGIMTLNDFKSIAGDLKMGIGSLPARLGPELAAKVACGVMLVPQVIVVAMLALNAHPVAATLVAGVTLAQVPLMRRLLQRPRELAPWYNQTGISLYVSGMMVTAVALGSVA